MLQVLDDVELSIKRTYVKKHQDQSYYRPTAVGLIVRDQSVLFVLSANSGTWGPTKGRVELDDAHNIFRASQREVKEEVGYDPNDFESMQYVGSALDHGFAGTRKNHRLTIGKNFHCVVLRLRSDCVKQPIPSHDEAILDAVWVDSINQFEKLPMKESRREIWRAALVAANVRWV